MHIMHIYAYFEFACIYIFCFSFRHSWSKLVMLDFVEDSEPDSWFPGA